MTDLVILVGRLARYPETHTTQGGTSITSTSVVTDRPARKDGKTYKDENGYTAKNSEFHRVMRDAAIASYFDRACSSPAYANFTSDSGEITGLLLIEAGGAQTARIR